jgi:hypothetical protein
MLELGFSVGCRHRNESPIHKHYRPLETDVESLGYNHLLAVDFVDTKALQESAMPTHKYVFIIG